jgi:hypothetical protein
MNCSKYSFSIIVQREKESQMTLFSDGEYSYYAIATNDFNTDGQEIINDHNLRGNAENHIKELKNGFGMESVPTNSIYSNAVYFSMGVIAYNLAIAFKTFLSHEYKSMTIASLRYHILSIPGKVVYHGRQLVLKINERFTWLLELVRQRHRLYVLTY